MAMANMNLIGVLLTKLWPVQALACGGGDFPISERSEKCQFGHFGNFLKHGLITFD